MYGIGSTEVAGIIYRLVGEGGAGCRVEQGVSCGKHLILHRLSLCIYAHCLFIRLFPACTCSCDTSVNRSQSERPKRPSCPHINPDLDKRVAANCTRVARPLEGDCTRDKQASETETNALPLETGAKRRQSRWSETDNNALLPPQKTVRRVQRATAAILRRWLSSGYERGRGW